MSKKTALIISAHSADFVWRCGGAIALHEEKGYDVTVVCLSYGERGESAKLWKKEGMTLDRVKTERRKEAENAAKALDVHDIQFFDLGDYPLELVSGEEAKDLVRQLMPAVEADLKVLVGFHLSDLQAEIFTFKQGERSGTTGISLKSRLLRFQWIKVEGQPFPAPQHAVA
ncbi:MAG: DUF3577 domain-containing protein [Rhizobiaceae bacterium]|nr:DUF3577 domain-containing protein [Rhizobiaceae bacterium]